MAKDHVKKMDRIVDGASTLGALMLFHDFRSVDVKSYVAMRDQEDTQTAKSSKNSKFAIENHEKHPTVAIMERKEEKLTLMGQVANSGSILKNGSATSETIQRSTEIFENGS